MVFTKRYLVITIIIAVLLSGLEGLLIYSPAVQADQPERFRRLLQDQVAKSARISGDFGVPAAPGVNGKESGLAPSPNYGPQLEAPRLYYTPQAQEKVLVILAKFPDIDNTRSKTFFETLIFGTGATDNSMYNYYKEVSYGQMLLSGTVIDWITLPHNLAYYGRDSGNVNLGTYVTDDGDDLDGN